ncbi:MAG: hypothetical protein HYX78_09005 [Armatimonadetes bacterium]|nr:hypothetical protein [Armatimonadota bacterium]
MTAQTITLLKDWNAGTGNAAPPADGVATWNSARYNEEQWETPGALGATDQADIVDPTFSNWPAGYWDWFDVDVTASLQQQADSGNYYGWVIRYVDGFTDHARMNNWLTGPYSPKLIVDYTPPANMVQISNVNCTFSETTATVTWTTDIPSSSIVDYGLTVTYGTTVTGPDGVTEHTVTIPGITPNTPVVHYRIKSSAAEYTTGESSDKIMPTLHIYPESIFIVPVAPDSVKIMWVFRDYHVTDPPEDPIIYGTYEIEWGETSAYGNSGDHINIGGVFGWNGHDHGAILTGLKSSTTYHFKVRERQSIDDESNTYLYAESGDMTFTTIGPNDVVANYRYETGVYEGAHDNTMNPADGDPGVHWGGNIYLNTHGGWDWIVKFNDLNIPSGSTAKKAYLQVWGSVWGESKATLNCHGLLKDWGESSRNGVAVGDGESSWLWAMYPTTQWAVGGAKGDGTDRNATPDDSVVLTNWWSYRSWDVTDSFLEQNSAGTYYGWMVERDPSDPYTSGDGLIFSAREFSMVQMRPALTVVFEPASIGPKIGELKNLPDDSDASVLNRTATMLFMFDDPMGFYIEDSDRSSGIFVATSAIVSEGAKVSVTGKMATMPSGERYIETSSGSVNVLSNGGMPGLLGMTNTVLGAPLTGPGMSNVGLLAKITGKVTSIVNSYTFYIDDGSSVTADGGNLGVKVVANENATVNEGDYVSVVGVVSVGLDGSQAYPVLRTTGSTRVVVLQAATP